MFYPDEKEKKESELLEKIQMKHLIIAFLILGMGCFVALIVFLLEMIGRTKRNEVEQANDSETQNMESLSHS